MDTIDKKALLAESALKIQEAAEILRGIRDKMDTDAAVRALETAADEIDQLETSLMI